MHRFLLGNLIVLTMGFCLSSLADAETLVLLSGQKIEGQIMEQTELHVMVNVEGVPETFFVGEIASIDGKEIPMPQDKDLAVDVAREDKVPAPYYNDEEDSLIRFMNVRKTGIAAAVAAPAAVVTPAAPAASPAPLPALPVAATAPATPPPAPGGTDKAVTTTPDGGIIVVDNEKITKYDQDFKVVKQVDLAVDSPVAAPPASASSPVASSPAASSPTPAAAASPPQDQAPETLKDFLDHLFSGKS